jgi:hypothetical protein
VSPSRVLATAVLLASAACASAPRANQLLAGGDSACAGERQVEVRNPLQDEVTVWARQMDGQLLRLNPTLRAGESRVYTIAGNVLLREVYGTAAPSMTSQQYASRQGPMQVQLSPVLRCAGFPKPAS